jgi:hypothetical protein
MSAQLLENPQNPIAALRVARRFVHGRFPYAGSCPDPRPAMAGVRKPSPCRSPAYRGRRPESGQRIPGPSRPGWVVFGAPLPGADALKSDVEHEAGDGPNPGRTAGLDVSTGDNHLVVLGSDVAEIECVTRDGDVRHRGIGDDSRRLSVRWSARHHVWLIRRRIGAFPPPARRGDVQRSTHQRLGGFVQS